jgi:hypothetical protein
MQTPEQMKATLRAFDEAERKFKAIDGGRAERQVEAESPPLQCLDMSAWDHAPIPERKWARPEESLPEALGQDLRR